MGQGSLAVGATVGMACATLLLVGAHRTFRRAGGAGPLRAFGIFWLGAAGYIGADALWTLASLLGIAPLPVALAVLQVKIAAVCASFAGIVVYLHAIYTGRRANLFIAAAYLGLFLALETFYFWRMPISVHTGFSSLSLDYARAQPALVWNALLLLLFVPPIVASVMYASLFRHASGDARRRIAWTSASLLLFFAPDMMGWLAGAWTGWDLIERILALFAGIGLMVATRPAAPARGRPSLEPGLALRLRDLV